MIVTVFLMVLFASSILSQMPAITSATTSRANQKTFRIGVISPETWAVDILESLFNQVIEPDINAYVAKLPRNWFTPYTKFEFQVADAEGSDETHLAMVKMFHKRGVDIIIGGFYSSQAAGSLDYVNRNHMLLISAGATAPGLAIPGDNLFRLLPDDTTQGKAIAAMLLSKGVKKAIVLQRDDIWANGIYDVFESEYLAGGGTILTRQPYPTDTNDFTACLIAAETVATGAPDEGVVILSFNEAAILITQAQDYPTIYGLPWFGADGTAQQLPILEGAPVQACHLRICSTASAPTRSLKFNEMAPRFKAALGFDMDFQMASIIDAAWIAAMGVIETHSYMTADTSAMDVIKVLPDDCSRYFGYGGWCALNAAGDRLGTNYEIWGYGMVDGEASFVLYGLYDSSTGQVTWYPT